MADERQHSSIVVDGVEQAPSRAMLYPVGFSEDDFNKRSERQIKAERENSRNWLTKWNKYPENDEEEVVKAEGMKIIESYEGKHK